MSDKITVTKKNAVYMEIDAEPSLLYEIKDHFTFDVPGAKYMPKFKMHLWDGKISLLNLPACTMYIGLLNKLIDFAAERGYDLHVDPKLAVTEDVTPQEVAAFVKELNVHSQGKPLEPHPHQLLAIYYSIKYKRLTLLSPTSSGKSYIIYCVVRWILAHPNTNILLIVPNIGLVRQMLSDFVDYSSHNGFDVENCSQMIAEGASKSVNSKIVVSTWQAVYKQPASWFNQFDSILVDEVHLAQATSIRGMMEKATDVEWRIGLTGTLSDAKTHELVINGLFGRIIRVATTAELITKGLISNIDIQCIMLNYADKAETKAIKGADYQSEIDYICNHSKRNRFIAKLALRQKGNTLVLFNYVEKHGQKIYDIIREEVEATDPTRKVFFIHGGVDGEERDDMRAIVEKEDNAIIVASYGTMSTGTNIRRLHNIIAASPTKSLIRVLQSIGRGLRKADGKTHVKWYDIADDLSGGRKDKNYAFVHFVKRLQIYTEQEFNYKIIKVDI